MLTIEDKGAEGERELNHWLRANGLAYVYIAQSPDTFAGLFPGKVKRPDFLVLLDSVGLIAVDAKNKAPFDGGFTLKMEAEVRRVLTFERVFRMPVWYAYLGRDEAGKIVWYWISALRAVEVGKRRVNRESSEEFLAIQLKYFAEVRTNEDLGKLYTHRLPGLANIHRLDPLV
jgi:Holliday junction resolvase